LYFRKTSALSRGVRFLPRARFRTRSRGTCENAFSRGKWWFRRSRDTTRFAVLLAYTTPLWGNYTIKKAYNNHKICLLTFANFVSTMKIATRHFARRVFLFLARAGKSAITE
jgi:hypothetical protein